MLTMTYGGTLGTRVSLEGLAKLRYKGVYPSLRLRALFSKLPISLPQTSDVNCKRGASPKPPQFQLFVTFTEVIQS